MPAIVPSPQRHHNARPWFWDVIAALALFGMAFALGKFFGKFLPILGLVLFAVNAGFGYYFAKAAWRGVTHERTGEGGGRKKRR